MSRRVKETYTQMNFFEDHYDHASKAIQSAVKESWAGFFGDHIFPLIDDSIFDPLYSSTGRPSAPVYLLYSLCLFEITMHIPEEQLFQRILTDLAFQYALHRTTDECLPFARSTYHRFKKKLHEHAIQTGNDLFFLCNVDLTVKLKSIAHVPKIFRNLEKYTIDQFFPSQTT
ncbi:MAG: transposase [Clostridia bacterium]|nr:transposase [Clostridia bacterium]